MLSILHLDRIYSLKETVVSQSMLALQTYRPPGYFQCILSPNLCNDNNPTYEYS